MLEVKDKNLSTIKCINIYSKNRTIKLLEEEWSKYKYAVLEKSQLAYNDIRKLLKNKKAYPVVMFYSIIENSLEQEEDIGKSINSIQHVWGYFKNKASEYEKNKYQKDIMKYQNNDIKLKSIKNFLFKMALKYEEEYLLNSYYFIL